MANALSTAIVGGLNKQSYRELIREGQEMQMKTTMNLMSLMESLQSQLVVNEEPPQEVSIHALIVFPQSRNIKALLRAALQPFRLAQNYVKDVNFDTLQTDPNLFKDCLKLLSSISQACTTVKGNVIPMNR